ncbi:envelope stress response membrane protein PspB [Pasteurellaceae bacterium HPA106]|uniref:envelope stress response membrane protein PspB n=1 Tax=Spirabiliibacterium pneumoniae TaxID=221400 RepID=UPI001AADB70A|nr:envelope stress response membrane protein PspB [Spirabiliibacterium pneumoniae]MBE2896793.1 envelope stress response membrane protein PspB [Spirabiliibacterium pneumoniae]
MIFKILALSIIAFIVCLIVLPLWLYSHYKKRKHIPYLGENSAEHAQLNALQGECKALRARIESLEAMLDYHQPHWREKH